MSTTFVLVVITITGLSFEERKWEAYYPQQMVGGLTYAECHNIVDRAKVWRFKEPGDEQVGSWWIETRLECWPEETS